MAKVKDNETLPERYTRNFGETDDDIDGLDGDDDLEPARPTPEQRDLAMLMDEIGASPKATVTIYRVTASKGKGAYIMQYPLSSKTLQEVMDYLRDVKKGGEFRFYIHDGQAMRANQPVTVEPPTPEEVREYEVKVKSANPYAQTQAPQPAQTDALALILQKMQDDQQRRDDQYREEQKRRDEQAREERRLADERAERELKRQEENNKFMLQLLTNNKPEKSSLSELLEGMVAMQALSGGNKKETSDLDMIDKVLNIQQKLVDNAPGNQKEESVVNTAIKNLGAPLLTILASMSQKPPVNAGASSPRQRRIAPPVASATEPAQPAPTPAETPATLTDQERITMLLAEIVQAANDNADPAPYADKLIEQLGDDACAEVADDDTAFEGLMSGLGQVAVDRREWFDRLRDIMLDSLFEDDTSAPTGEQDTAIPNASGA